ncbi:phosphodiester glycosidase family protein [uncultured Roseobacter sp.]|uniref:phosphodiester glycosidase family protein n=1 Tax=uncultured Roseobacter sp. TaxID=114847 RepID=UPI0026144DB1|nr:phosphodiester glycosidase family protein [uncultured Roseobacter sp.]
MIRNAIVAAALMLTAASAGAVDCRSVDFDGASYTVCEADASGADLRLFLRNGDGSIYGQFFAIDRDLATRGKKLLFAMNAGMYHEDRAPVGHYVENGVEEMRIIPNAGPGNFGLLPNGVLCLRDGRADVIETLSFVADDPGCRDATQSGPMLVIDGALHPKFLEDGTSKYIRNGVGTSADGRRIVFAISNEAVNFHSFGRLFRDALETDNALFLDGNISRLYAPGIGRNDFGFRLGPIVGVVGDAE